MPAELSYFILELLVVYTQYFTHLYIYLIYMSAELSYFILEPLIVLVVAAYIYMLCSSLLIYTCFTHLSIYCRCL